MRILQLAQFLPPIAGGEERHVWNLSRALAARAHDVTLLGLAGGPMAGDGPGETHADGVRVVRVRSSAARLSALYGDPTRPHALPLPDPAVRRAVAGLLAAMRFDVVHAHNWIVNSALAPAARAGVPLVLTLHDYSHRCATKRFMRGGLPCPGPSPARCIGCATDHYGLLRGPVTAIANARSAARRAEGITAVMAVSSPVAAASGLAAQVIPNFIPAELIVADVAPPGESAPLLFVGDLSRDKGLPVLLEAYRRLGSTVPLVLAGRQVGDMGRLPAGARWAGELAHADVVALYRSARAVVVPSVWPDPCPTVVLEAMAAGRPLVASATGGIVDLVDHGRTGLLVPPGDVGALADAMAMLLRDPLLANRFGVAGRDRARMFTVDAVVERIEATYAAAVGRTVGRR